MNPHNSNEHIPSDANQPPNTTPNTEENEAACEILRQEAQQILHDPEQKIEKIFSDLQLLPSVYEQRKEKQRQEELRKASGTTPSNTSNGTEENGVTGKSIFTSSLNPNAQNESNNAAPRTTDQLAAKWKADKEEINKDLSDAKLHFAKMFSETYKLIAGLGKRKEGLEQEEQQNVTVLSYQKK